MSRLAYRPDIDGLRAVAVLLVVAYHFGVPGVTGGYIGVDLFFVISGFLIASIFEREPDMTLERLFAFYGRRIQRLMPAFLFVAACTVVAAAALLLPDDFQSLLKSVRESLVFRANLFFDRETTGYFGATAAELPWLHTWSLSVEWQFYLAFPLVSLLLGRLPAGRRRTAIAWGLVACGIALSTVLVAHDPADAYFSAIARFFEFLMGAFATTIDGSRVTAKTSRGSSIAGVAALVALALVFTAGTPFPGLDAFVVCLVGVVLLATGGERSLLAHRWAACLGQRSYSIYLWHWPVIALLTYVQRRPAGLETAGWLLLVLALSEASYRRVERPGIALRWTPRRAFLTCCLVPFAGSAVLLAVVRNHDGYPQRLGPEATHAQANLRGVDVKASDHCHDERRGDIESCAFGDPRASRLALMIGDSHARHFRPFVQVLAEAAHVKVYGLTDSECLTLESTGPSTSGPARSLGVPCINAIARDYAFIRANRFDYVVLAQRWIGYPAERLAGLDETLDVIVASGAVPVVILSAAEDGTSTKDCFYRLIKVHGTSRDDCDIRADNDFARVSKRQVAELMAAMRRRHPSLVLIDPQRVQCRDGRCITIVDRTPIYSDTHHLDAFGATMLALRYREQVGNPFDR